MGMKIAKLNVLICLAVQSIGRMAFADEASFSGNASWYGKPFHGRKTASGEIFDMNKLTSAHKTLPLMTKVLVENPKNGKSAIVKVNDRGPYVKTRVMDLSRQGADNLGYLSHGTAHLDFTPIGKGKSAPYADKKDSGKSDAPKVDAAKTDADKKDEPKKDDVKNAEVKKDEPKKDADVKKDADKPAADADKKVSTPDKKDAATKPADKGAGSQKDAAAGDTPAARRKGLVEKSIDNLPITKPLEKMAKPIAKPISKLKPKSKGKSKSDSDSTSRSKSDSKSKTDN